MDIRGGLEGTRRSDHEAASPTSSETRLLPAEDGGKAQKKEDSSNKKRKSASDRGLHLESLRALACIMVVFFHCGDPSVGGFDFIYDLRTSLLASRYARCSPLVGFCSGQYPVSIFFTLSGYVLVQTFMRTRNVPDLVRQCHKRLLRLVPPSAAVYSVYFFMLRNGSYEQLHGALPAHDPGDEFAKQGIIGLLFLAKGSMVQLWTISYEFSAPFLLLCIGAMSPKPSSPGTCLRAAIVGASFILIPLCCTYTVPLSCFALGYYIAELELAVAHPVSRDGAKWKSAACQTAVTCLAFSLSMYAHWLMGHRDDLADCSHFEPCQLPHSIAAASLVWLAVSSRVLAFLLWLTGLHMIAFLTFSVYLTHLLVLHCLHYWRDQAPPERGPQFVILITVASASVLYLFVEKPFTWLSGQFAEWMLSPSVTRP